MPRPVFFCVDIGTSSLKGAFFSFSGERVCVRRENLRPLSNPAAWNAENWADAFRRLAASCYAASGGGAVIEGAALSGNGPTLVPLGKDGRPVFPALMWMDKREIALPGEKSLFLPKAAWLAREKPDIYEKTVTFLGCPEYLVFRLTGEKHAFSPSAEFSPYIWTPEAAAAHGLEPSKFPAAIETSREAGRVSAAAAREFGITEGAPVYAAGPDFLLTLLGTAAVRPGRVCDRAGTSEGLNVCRAAPVDCPPARCLPHVIRGYWNSGRLLPHTGRVFEWLRAVSGQAGIPYEDTLREIGGAAAGLASAGAGNFLWFYFASGGGEGGGAPGVFINKGKPVSVSEALRVWGRGKTGLAVVCAVGFAVRRAAGELEQAGPVDAEIRVSGGQAKSPAWNRLKANLAGKPLLVPEIPDAELTGNLAAGLYGRGDYGTLSGAAESLVRFRGRYAPEEETKNLYDDLYETYTGFSPYL